MRAPRGGMAGLRKRTAMPNVVQCVTGCCSDGAWAGHLNLGMGEYREGRGGVVEVVVGVVLLLSLLLQDKVQAMSYHPVPSESSPRHDGGPNKGVQLPHRVTCRRRSCSLDLALVSNALISHSPLGHTSHASPPVPMYVFDRHSEHSRVIQRER
jgi:hypothetical protein